MKQTNSLRTLTLSTLSSLLIVACGGTAEDANQSPQVGDGDGDGDGDLVDVDDPPVVEPPELPSIGLEGVVPGQCEECVSGEADLYVDCAATAAGEGANWGEPYEHPSDAIVAAAPGDVIWIREGVCRPLSQRLNLLTIEKDLTLIGGFAGDEMDASERHGGETVLSGDFSNDDDDEEADTRRENAPHVVEIIGADVTLAHLTIERGSPLNPPEPIQGGGVLVRDAGALSAESVILSSNAGRDGGGIAVIGSSAEVRNSEFLSNTVDLNGAGIYVSEGTVLVEGSLFFQGESPFGAGIGTDASSSAITVSGSAFVNNFSFSHGGGIYAEDGSMDVSESLFLANTSAQGGHSRS